MREFLLWASVCYPLAFLFGLSAGLLFGPRR